MEKKEIIRIVLVSVAVFLWIFFIGNLSGVSGISGDINIIDEGQYAAWVHRMLQGQIIYTDFFLQYSPLQIFPIYLLTKYFGMTIFFVRFVTFVLSVFFGISIVIIFYRLFKINPVLQIVSVLFLLLYPGINFRQWIGVLSLVLLVQGFKRKSGLITFASGIFVTISLLYSIEIGVFTLVVVALYIIFQFVTSKKLLNVCYQSIIFFFGVIIPLTIFSIFASSQGWLGDYVHTSAEILANLSGTNLPNGQGLPSIEFSSIDFQRPINIVTKLFSKESLYYWTLIILVMFFVVSLIRFLLRKNSPGDSTVALIIIFSLINYLSTVGRSGHAMLLVPFVVVIASFFLTFLLQSKVRKEWIVILLFVFFGLYLFRYLSIFRFDFATRFSGQKNLTYSVPNVSPLQISEKQAQSIVALQKFIENDSLNEKVFILNNSPYLYSVLIVNNPTRYDLPLLAYSVEKRQQIINSLRQSSDTIIIEDTLAWKVDGISDRERQPELVSYLNENYFVFAIVGQYKVYKENK